jgi:hypothetical protein
MIEEKNKSKKPYILKMDPLEVQSLYQELGTITAVANHYDADLCTMAAFFRRMQIPYVKQFKKHFKEDFFSTDTPDSFYLAGFLAADGNVSSRKYTVSLNLGIKDIDHLGAIKELIGLEGTIGKVDVFNSRRNKNWKDTVNCFIHFSSPQTVSDLRRFNVVPKKTKIYDLPDWMIDHPLTSHFMRGYFDGDGHIGIRHVAKTHGTTSKLRFHVAGNFSFLSKYQEILERECGIHHNDVFTRPNGLSCLEYVGNIIVPKVCRFLYHNSAFHMERKFNIYAPFANQP